ncbi:MAG: radical SAM protein, partial [Chitinivibrionales bacterium]|nr:radical SAM protein [Chitinivibrionales bacterium]
MTVMTEQIVPQTSPRVGDSISVRRYGDGAVLYDAESGRQRHLNGTGWFILRHLDGIRNAADIAALTAAHFADASPDEILADTSSFLADLAADGFIRGAAEGEEPVKGPLEAVDIADAPRSVDISVTGRCNQHCRYCFYAEQMQTRPDLPTDAWLAFFGQLGSLGVRSVCLSGGEVFARSDIWELIDAVVDNRMRYTLLTNGTLITEETVDRLSRGRYRVRLDSIQVSL